MHRRKGYIYPRIVAEMVDTKELCKVWNCQYLTVNRILYGRKIPNHVQKKQLSDYLGIPVEELFFRIDPDPIPKDYAFVDLDLLHPATATTADNSEINQEFNDGVAMRDSIGGQNTYPSIDEEV